jgi:FlaA1/EpsC-like NDP-sugar epimerase
LNSFLEGEVECKRVPGLGENAQSTLSAKQIRDVSAEELLGRTPVHLDQESIRERIQGRVVLVTGAAGSIGSELCRQIARFSPLALVGLDCAETPLFYLEREMVRSIPELAFHPELGDFGRAEFVERVLRRHRPAILYHAAAYKHVPLLENQVFAAVENNIFGTWQMALAAARYGVDDFVLISTDKAVRPAGIMGATKRMAELALRALQKPQGTRFITVRFGNVLASNGSVVLLFKEQIAAGGPLTVTHPEMRRYFMTVTEAAQLVLQAFSIGRGGETFVLDMGKPIKIVDLARNLIRLSNWQPDREIEIQFTGVRPGEKLFEELNLHDEHMVPTSHAKIWSCLNRCEVDAVRIEACIGDLEKAVSRQDVHQTVLLLKELIADYNPNPSLLEQKYRHV